MIQKGYLATDAQGIMYLKTERFFSQLNGSENEEYGDDEPDFSINDDGSDVSLPNYK